MSRKNLILIVLGTVILMVGGLLFFYFNTNKVGTGTQNTFTPDTTNPFGTNTVNKPNATTTTTENQNQTGIKEIAKLFELYRNPTSGAVFFSNKNNKEAVRFVDRANSNIYEYVLDSQTGEPTRITNTTIPKIQESVWSGTGDNLVLRYLNDDTDIVNSFSGKIKVSTTTSGEIGSITGLFLPSNIKQLAINPKGDKIFGLFTKADGSGSYGVTYSFDLTSKKQIFDSPLSLLNISWPKEDTITLTTKPSYKDFGYLFFFNTTSGSINRILGNVVGLSTLTNNTASLVAYSGTAGDSFNLDVYDVKTKLSKKYEISTLADKCVWGTKDTAVLYCAVPQIIPGNAYPDAWYLGVESFSDDIWMIDTSSGATKLIYNIGANENVSIDAINLRISSDDQYLIFTNKADLSLWLLQTQ